MAILPIVEFPNPLLKKPTEKVQNFGKENEEIIKNLKDTLDKAKEPEGAGLSANQIGVSKSICVVRDFLYGPDGMETDEFEETVLINPKVTGTSKETETDWEGCLSVPDKYGRVVRPLKVKVSYQDETGKIKKLNAKGFFARVIQHEVDHLNGIVFTEKVTGRIVPGEYFGIKE